ncbi:uncharacterized protein VTP21DRAFT_7060 [Calcarisporiella thermophila]|uniref:uncharacterized protein n=1 Tax=Calcarisporiella thermophila TaxID=911321 RepID=UPI0037424CE0
MSLYFNSFFNTVLLHSRPKDKALVPVPEEGEGFYFQDEKIQFSFPQVHNANGKTIRGRLFLTSHRLILLPNTHSHSPLQSFSLSLARCHKIQVVKRTIQRSLLIVATLLNGESLKIELWMGKGEDTFRDYLNMIVESETMARKRNPLMRRDGKEEWLEAPPAYENLDRPPAYSYFHFLYSFLHNTQPKVFMYI